MSTRFLLGLLLSVVLVPPARAQITITEADVRARLGPVMRTTTYTAADDAGLQSAVDGAGGGLTFDLRAAAFNDGTSHTVEVLSCAPQLIGCDDPYLGSANLVLREVFTTGSVDSVAVSFARLTPEAFSFLGAAAQGEFDDEQPGLETVTMRFVPAMVNETYPLTAGTVWSSSSALESSEMAGFNVRIDMLGNVDGWGTLHTPSGSEAALRIRERTITSVSLGGGMTWVDTTFAVRFATKGDVSASIDVDRRGRVLGGEYSVSRVISSNEPPEGLPRGLTLAQNYPNPFNPSTVLAFELPAPAHVVLTVYDVTGRAVAVLADRPFTAGRHEVRFEAGALPSGTYLYRVEAGDYRAARTMLLLR